MIVDCISDLHGYIPELFGGDLLIVAGDLTKHGTHAEMIEFAMWLEDQKYKKIVVVPGNHDNMLMGRNAENYFMGMESDKVNLLVDRGITFMNKKIWGMPWTMQFKGQNPFAKAFTYDSEDMIEEMIVEAPIRVDILVTHSPAYGIRDYNGRGHCGSRALLRAVEAMKPAIHVFGHIHESYGKEYSANTCYINASQVDGNYRHVHLPIRIEL